MPQEYKIISEPEYRDVIDYAITIYESNLIKGKKNIFTDPFDQKLIDVILDKIEFDADLSLNYHEMLFVFILLDYVNNLLLMNTPPYSEIEMEFFTNSELFFKKYNNTRDKDFKSKWIKYKAELIQTGNSK
jgi:hypothetical protein